MSQEVQTKPRKQKTESKETQESQEMNKFLNKNILDLLNYDQSKKLSKKDQVEDESENSRLLPLSMQKEMYVFIAELLQNNPKIFISESIYEGPLDTFESLNSNESFLNQLSDNNAETRKILLKLNKLIIYSIKCFLFTSYYISKPIKDKTSDEYKNNKYRINPETIRTLIFSKVKELLFRYNEKTFIELTNKLNESYNTTQIKIKESNKQKKIEQEEKTRLEAEKTVIVDDETKEIEDEVKEIFKEEETKQSNVYVDDMKKQIKKQSKKPKQ